MTVAGAAFAVVFAAAYADAAEVSWLAVPAVVLGTVGSWLVLAYFIGGVWRRFRARRNSHL